MNNSLNVWHIFWIPAVRLLDTLLREGLPHGDLYVQRQQHLLLGRRRRPRSVKARLCRPRRLNAVHRQGSESPEQSPEVVDGLTGSRAPDVCESACKSDPFYASKCGSQKGVFFGGQGPKGRFGAWKNRDLWGEPAAAPNVQGGMPP